MTWLDAAALALASVGIFFVSYAVHVWRIERERRKWEGFYDGLRKGLGAERF